MTSGTGVGSYATRLPSPFADAMGASLTDWQPLYNEVQEVVGLRLWFDGREVPIIVQEGEVTT